jgi:hypothetical protein
LEATVALFPFFNPSSVAQRPLIADVPINFAFFVHFIPSSVVLLLLVGVANSYMLFFKVNVAPIYVHYRFYQILNRDLGVMTEATALKKYKEL